MLPMSWHAMFWKQQCPADTQDKTCFPKLHQHFAQRQWCLDISWFTTIGLAPLNGPCHIHVDKIWAAVSGLSWETCFLSGVNFKAGCQKKDAGTFCVFAFLCSFFLLSVWPKNDALSFFHLPSFLQFRHDLHLAQCSICQSFVSFFNSAKMNLSNTKSSIRTCTRPSTLSRVSALSSLCLLTRAKTHPLFVLTPSFAHLSLQWDTWPFVWHSDKLACLLSTACSFRVFHLHWCELRSATDKNWKKGVLQKTCITLAVSCMARCKNNLFFCLVQHVLNDFPVVAALCLLFVSLVPSGIRHIKCVSSLLPLSPLAFSFVGENPGNWWAMMCSISAIEEHSNNCILKLNVTVQNGVAHFLLS